MKNILVISYLFPPAGNVGVLRTVRFVSRLPEFGWQPIVLTASNAKVPNLEPSLVSKIRSDVSVVKCPSFEWLNSGKRVDRNGETLQLGLLSRAIRKFPSDFWRYVAAPDEKIGWVPFAVRAGARIIKQQPVDAIYVSGKPFSSFLIGEKLSRRFGIPWVMDLRDLWTLNPRIRPKNRLHGFVNPRLERRLVRNAALVVANTPGNRIDFVESFPECPAEKFVAITNGYDEDDFVNINGKKYDRFTIGYSGTLYCGKGSARNKDVYDTYSPRYLFQALTELFREDPEMANRTELLFTGSSCNKIGPFVAEYGLESNVRSLGWVTYADSLEVVKRSHLVPLLLSSGQDSAGWIPSKLFQFLGAGTPILALVPEGDVANIVRETSGGTVVAVNNVEQIKMAIREAYLGYKVGRTHCDSRQDVVERYESRQLTAQLTEALHRICPRLREAEHNPQRTIHTASF